MRKVSGDHGPVLPWLLVRQDASGNRYRVGSYATRAEAQQMADRLAAQAPPASRAPGDGYLVEARDRASGG
ncbi:SPOR domain-containing protein [Streptomyces sp. TR06-5]|uniref:SPOR domain-containing protein n=1 Tax=unclassified Streptomyces TaxID=2593676 RepID=UPI0039A1ED14